MAIVARRVVRWSIKKSEHAPETAVFNFRLLAVFGNHIIGTRVILFLVESGYITGNEETVFARGRR